MQVIFTNYFIKNLSKISQLQQNDIVKLLSRYPNTQDLVILDNFNDSFVIKGYLLHKKVRLLVLLEYKKGKFVPTSIIKKSSPKGENITKENYKKLFLTDINNNIRDIKLGLFAVVSV